MRTVIEFTEFYKKAVKIFGNQEREKIVEFLSSNPHAGKKLENFGGIRKLEWIHHGTKPKEYKIYYYSGSKNLPLIIIGIFPKGEKLVLDKLIEILLHSEVI